MNIADQWIKHTEYALAGNTIGSTDDVCFDSVVQLSELCRSNPISAWNTIIEIFSKSEKNTLVLECLGSGPVEDLLAFNGHLVINKIIEFTSENSGFKYVLGSMWPNQIPDPIWSEIQLILAR